MTPPPRVPAWRRLLPFVGFGAGVACVLAAPHVFLLGFLAVVGAVFLVKLARGLAAKTPLPYGWALGAIVVALLGATVGAIAFFEVQIEQRAEDMAGRLETSLEKLRDRLVEHPWYDGQLRGIPVLGEALKDGDADDGSTTPDDAPSATGGEPHAFGPHGPPRLPARTNDARPASPSTPFTPASIRRAFGWVSNAFATTLGVLTSLLVVGFMALFLAAEPELYVRGALRLAPAERREQLGELAGRLGDTLWRWCLGRLLAMTVTGVGTGLVLWVLGVPLPLTIGVISGALAFVPNVGAAISLGLASLVAFPEGLDTVAWVAALYVGIQVLESNVFTPLIQREQVAVPPALVIAVQLLMATLTGFLGLMVATPLVAVVLAAFRSEEDPDEVEPQHAQTAHPPAVPEYASA